VSKSDALIRPIKTSEYDTWREVLASSQDGSPYQLPEYLEFLANATGSETRLIGIFEGDDPVLVGGVGLLCARSALTRYSSSGLLLYYNGPFITKHAGMSDSRDERRRLRLLDALGKFLMKEDLDFVRFKVRFAGADYRPLLSLGWKATPVYTYLMRTDNLVEQWNDIDRNLKRLIRRGESDGLLFNDAGNFDDFYDMHVETHDRKQSPIYMERAIFGEFIANLVGSGIARLFEVRTPDGAVAASQLVLFSKHPVAHSLAASSRAEYQRTGCNPFLRWKICEWLNVKGYQGMDLTDAHILSVARFKSEMGAKLTLAMEYQSPVVGAARIRHTAVENINLVRTIGGRLYGKARQR
jgi:hypothetical protein